MELSIERNELYNLIKEAVREVLNEERIDFFLKEIPSVSQEEAEDIRKLYGEPPAKKEAAYEEIIDI